MFNLILKDILIQKKNVLIVLIYSILGVYFFINIPYGAFTIIAVATTYILSQGAFTLDEKTNAEMMINSLPIERKTVVQAKYISTYIYLFVSIIMYFVVTFIYAIILKNNILISTLRPEVFIAGFIAVILNTGISFPLYFKLGITKSRYIVMLVFIGTFGFAGALSGITSEVLANNNFNLGNSIEISTSIGVVIVGLLIHFFTYLISIKQYESRQF